MEHDILPHGEGEVAVYNLCTDTTRHMNGVVTNMHPSEGVWLFRSTCEPEVPGYLRYPGTSLFSPGKRVG